MKRTSTAREEGHMVVGRKVIFLLGAQKVNLIWHHIRGYQTEMSGYKLRSIFYLFAMLVISLTMLLQL